MRVLVDNSIVRDAIVGEWVRQGQTVDWAGRSATANVVVMRRRPLPSEDQSIRRQGVLALPTIRRLVLQGLLQLATYEELNAEFYVGKDPAGGSRGDLLAGIKLIEVEAAVSRSHFHQLPMDKYWTKEAFTTFCKMLLELKPSVADAHAMERLSLPPSTVASIRDLKRFQDLCQGAQEHHFSDLFHIWTGERSGCDYFLTMEKRICNWIANSCSIQPLCVPIRPHELIARLGITTLDPMPFAEGEILSAMDAMDGVPSGVEWGIPR